MNVSECLGLKEDIVDYLVDNGLLEVSRWQGITYARLRVDLKGYPKDSIILVDPCRVVKPFRGWRVAYNVEDLKELIGDERVYVEDLVLGLRAYILTHRGKLIVLLGDGKPSEYLSLKILDKYGDKLIDVLSESNVYLVAAIVGYEEPYLSWTQPPYDRTFGVIVHEVCGYNQCLDVQSRNKLVDELGLGRPVDHGLLSYDELHELFRRVEEGAGLGLVVRIGEEKVALPSLKLLQGLARWSYIMGHRVLDVAVKGYAYRLAQRISDVRLEERYALELGRAILLPLAELFRSRMGKIITVEAKYADVLLGELASRGYEVKIIGTEKDRISIALKPRLELSPML